MRNEPLVVTFGDDPGRAVLATPIGPLGLHCTDDGLSGVWFDGPVPMRPGPTPTAAARRHLERTIDELTAYFGRELTEFAVPVDLAACSPFSRSVLGAVAAVPYGERRTYADIARQVGRPGSVRAVGRANATNPVPLVVPCHRIVGSNGSLTGYGGGLERKDWLLAHEAGW
jgi:methylated-DNA-[protein]-cysteine S-methyltransferase